MAINTGPTSYGKSASAGQAMQRGTMNNRVASQRPTRIMSPTGPGNARSNPIFGSSVMPGMEGMADSPNMPSPTMPRPGFNIPGGGFMGGRNRGPIEDNGPMMPQGPMKRPMPPVEAGGSGIGPSPFINFGYNGAKAMGNMGNVKSASMGYRPQINTRPTGY